MTDFEKGVEYAMEYIKKNMVGMVINGSVKSAITKEKLEKIKKTIHKRCDFCEKPCENSWCSTKSKK